MYPLIAGLIIFCLSIILLVYYRNFSIRKQEANRVAILEKEMQIDEQERIRAHKLARERQEKELTEQQNRHHQIKTEVAPLIDKFITTNYVDVWLPNMHFARMILEGYPISLQEFLQHNVTRRFPDGSSYKVGISKMVSDADISLYPATVEQLQEYFVAFLELYGSIRNRNISIEKQQLHEILWEKMEHKRK